MIAVMSLDLSSTHLPRVLGYVVLTTLFTLFVETASVGAGVARAAASHAPPAPAAADPVAAGLPRLVSLNPSLTAIV
jgi:hypothetical protein